MTVLSFIAIVASVLAGLSVLFSEFCSFFVLFSKTCASKTTNTPVWKRVLKNVCRWFNLDTAPIWRRLLLKALWSVLILVAIGCGFWDSYSALGPKSKGVISALLCTFSAVASCAILAAAPYFATQFKKCLSRDYFKMSDFWNGTKITALNIAIFCIWLIVFAICVYLQSAGCVFCFVSISVAITALICIILFIICSLGWVILKAIWYIIILPLRCYIKWLLK